MAEPMPHIHEQRVIHEKVLTTRNDYIYMDVIPVGPLMCNCTRIANVLTKEAVIIDPGGDADLLLQWLRENEFTLKAVYHTHAHFDHFLASEELRQATGAPLYLHDADRLLWDNLHIQCRVFGVRIPSHKTHPPDGEMEDGMPLHLEGLGRNETLYTPGHTPGSCCIHFEEHGILIAGDTLFRGGIGRTDLWGGDYDTIKKSITQRLMTLEGETAVVTGHGFLTHIADEHPFA